METKNYLLRFGTITDPKKPEEIKELVVKVKLFDGLPSCFYLLLGDACAIPAQEYTVDTEKSSQEPEKWFDIKDDEGWLTINSKKHIYDNRPPINSKKHMYGYYQHYVCEWRRPLMMFPPEPIPVEEPEPAKDWETNSLTKNANRITIDVFFKLHFSHL